MTSACEQTPGFPAFYRNFCIFRTATIPQGKTQPGVRECYLIRKLPRLASINLQSIARNNSWHSKRCLKIVSIALKFVL